MKKSLIGTFVGALVAAPLAVLALPGPASAAVTTEGFATVPPASWTTANNSSPLGALGVFQGTVPGPDNGPFVAQAGPANSYAAMNFNSTTGGTGTISTWLITPQYNSLSNGDIMSFYTRKPTIGPGQTDYPDRLEVRMSTNGTCSPGTGATNVGDFTTLLTTVNPSLVVGGYPQVWTQITATLSGIAGAKTGCFAFRYFVTNAGPLGSNSDYIGIDTYAYDDQPTDVTAPNTTLNSGPAPGTTTNDPTPTFTFSSNEGGSTFECRVDAAAFAPCTSPFTTAALADGVRTFDVRAIDAAANTDPTPATSTFTVDTTAPQTTLNSGPAPGTTTNDPTPTFGFGSSEPGSTFECRVGADAFAPCTSPFTTASLTDGVRTFDVRATDAVGNTDATPASSTFTVDTVAPDTSITSGPATGTTTGDATPTFEFDSSEAGATFACNVDSAGFSSCSSPFTTAVLGDGPHTFDVRATDAGGNTDGSPASSSFTVDTVAPDTSISSGPATGTTTTDTTPTFGFSSTKPGSTFECSVDAAAFGPCSGPAATHTTAALPLGAHTFSVRATDTVGNADATPATSSFTVVAPTTTPPGTTPPDCTPQAAAVTKAKAKLAKAKAKLKKAKKGGKAPAVKKAKAKVKKAKKALKAASAALATCQAG